jgi:nucleoside-diphosphate-sugar epimerase
MQPGYVFATYADLFRLQKFTEFQPSICIEEGLSRLVNWFRSYY